MGILKNHTRKDFLRNLSCAALSVSVPHLLLSATAERSKNKIRLAQNDIILFTGDSITDASRIRELYKTPNLPRALGSGYAALAGAHIYRRHPQLDLKIHNTGINGDTIVKLQARWEQDCLQLKPTIVSILVGVNDFNIAFTGSGKGDPDLYLREYRDLLRRTKESLPGVRLVIGEPYAIKGAREKIDKWYPSFNEYKTVAQQVAKEFDAVFIPYQKIYEDAGRKTPAGFYSRDGIHPSLAGIDLMSEAWCAIIDK